MPAMEHLADFGAPLDGPVSANAVEDALAAAWHQIRSTREAGQPVARASVLSLIVCVADTRAAESALEAINRLSRQHPSRTIILLPGGPLDQEDLRVWHRTACTLGPDHDQVVCGEQIVLAARDHAIGYLPSLTDQLMLTDLPAFLWWVGDLPSVHQALFERLAAMADRLIVDSSGFASLGTSLVRLEQIARRRHHPCAPSDLNWARLTPLRELITQFFDAPAARPFLARLDDVAITFSGASGAGAAQAALLVGWLARQLGWQRDGEPPIRPGGSIHGRLRRADGRVVNVVAQSVPDSPLEGIVRLGLNAGDAAHFAVVRENGTPDALTEADLASAPSLRRIARCAIGDTSSLLADELGLFQRDRAYENALRGAVSLGSVVDPRS